MNLTLIPHCCEKGACLPLAPRHKAPGMCHELETQPGEFPGVGCAFYDNAGEKIFAVRGHVWLPGTAAASAPLLMALRRIDAEMAKPAQFSVRKEGYALAAVTISDKGSQGLREDGSGPLMVKLAAARLKLAFSQNFLLPDDANLLRGLLAELALTHKYDLILTSGGTGISPRDITPETTERLLDRAMPGISQAILRASLARTDRTIISRACAGIIGKCLALNLPGSPKAVAECLEPVLPALGHALAKLNGDSTDCGG